VTISSQEAVIESHPELVRSFGAAQRDTEAGALLEPCTVFDGADLRGADFSGAAMVAAADCGPSLVQASEDLSRVARVSLSGARLDEATRWPAGFDPRAAGALVVDSTRSQD